MYKFSCAGVVIERERERERGREGGREGGRARARARARARFISICNIIVEQNKNCEKFQTKDCETDMA